VTSGFTLVAALPLLVMVIYVAQVARGDRGAVAVES
jgi:hypothetical protein